MPRPRVIILRELDSQATGGSCCGQLDGGLRGEAAASPFAARRADMEEAGRLARTVQAEFGAAAVVAQVDPRNLFAAWLMLVRDCLRGRRGWRALLRALSFHVRVPSVFVDGVPVAAETWPSAGTVVRAVRDRLPPSSR